MCKQNAASLRHDDVLKHEQMRIMHERKKNTNQEDEILSYVPVACTRRCLCCLKQNYVFFFVSHCPAGSLFGVIGADGQVYPCEILDRPLGNLRDYDLNFMKVWQNPKTSAAKKFIKDSNCHCSYECAWSINIISNKKYIPKLISESLKQKL